MRLVNLSSFTKLAKELRTEAPIKYRPWKSQFLMTQDVTEISKEQCKARSEESYNLGLEEPNQLCAEYVRNYVENLFQYHSGAPVMVNGRVDGIIIKGMGCPISEPLSRPIIYSDVGFFHD